MNYYDKNADSFTASTVNIDVDFLYNEFCSHLSDGALILDAGCGPGRDIAYFIRRGCTVEAFDSSYSMVSIAKERTGIDVKQTTFEAFKTTKQFDGIWCCASLLHVPFRDLKDTLRDLIGFLKSRGVIYISFKYGEGERQEGDRRFTDLTEKSLSSLVTQVGGLEEVKIWKTNDVRPGRSDIWLNAIYRRA